MGESPGSITAEAAPEYSGAAEPLLCVKTTGELTAFGV